MGLSTPAPLKKHCGNNARQARKRKAFRPAVRPYVARKVVRVSRETAERDLGRHVEDFLRDVRPYRPTEGLTFPGPFPIIPTVFLEGGWRGEDLCKALPPQGVSLDCHTGRFRSWSWGALFLL